MAIKYDRSLLSLLVGYYVLCTISAGGTHGLSDWYPWAEWAPVFFFLIMETLFYSTLARDAQISMVFSRKFWCFKMARFFN